MKKLKLRIAKFDKLIVVEQLERKGEFYETEHFNVGSLSVDILGNRIRINTVSNKNKPAIKTFDTNQERDEYAANLIKWITEEQFGGVGKLEIGKLCLISDDGKNWKMRFYAGKVAKQLGTDKRHLAKADLEDDCFCCWKYAKPLNFVQPKIDGEIYTWEVE